MFWTSGRAVCRLRFGALAVAIALLATGCDSPAHRSSTALTTTTSTTSTSITTPSGPKTLVNRSDSGSLVTWVFTVPVSASGWNLDWSYTCRFKPPSIFSFVASVYQGPRPDRHDKAVAESGSGGQGSEHYKDTGQFSLHIAGYPNTCSWMVKASTPGG